MAERVSVCQLAAAEKKHRPKKKEEEGPARKALNKPIVCQTVQVCLVAGQKENRCMVEKVSEEADVITTALSGMLVPDTYRAVKRAGTY